MEDFIAGYREFIDRSKTERLFIRNAVEEARSRGFVPAADKDTLSVGDKVYFENRRKNLVLAVIGRKPLSGGFRLISAHVDSPRLDLKPRPLYEEGGLTLLKTQYYGGIKKYQWASIPLSMIGTVVLKSGASVDISLGESEDDPVFTIPDLLPHLAKNIQNERTTVEVIKGEELHVLVGTSPKAFLLEKLKTDFGMEEEDFLSAELELVPSFRSREIGLDLSLVGAYGQDDRSCAYAALDSLWTAEDRIPDETALVYLVDKEETGSIGATGMDSQYLEYVIEELLTRYGESGSAQLRKTLWNGKALAADVTVAFDPVFKAAHDEQNAAKLGGGIVLSKFIGPGGKMNCQDADAEYVAEIRRKLTEAGVAYQGAAFGKVDEGGGGTVARFLAAKGLQVLNAGPALLGMHSPFEIASKFDLFETVRAFRAFLGTGQKQIRN